MKAEEQSHLARIRTRTQEAIARAERLRMERKALLAQSRGLLDEQRRLLNELTHGAKVPVAMSARATAGFGVRVLVVDDVDYVARGLVRLLKTMGSDVQCITDPGQALAEARRLKPDIAFLDLGMPGMTGYELACQLRLEFPCDALKLVAVTADHHAEARAKGAGFDAFVAKPFDCTELEAILRS